MENFIAGIFIMPLVWFYYHFYRAVKNKRQAKWLQPYYRYFAQREAK